MTLVRPAIGITSAMRWTSDDEGIGREVRRHADLLESLGAEVVVLARGRRTAEALERHQLAGVLLSGGGDVEASLYGGRTDLSWDRADSERDSGELTLVRKAFAGRVPTLCVCRGIQVANVAFGGTLIEDIKTELGASYTIKHHQVRELEKQHNEHSHEVRLDAGSGLAKIVGSERFLTNSIHHQAIRAVAAPLRAVGYTDDQIIEAVELAVPDFFFFGVQWHPESLPSDEASRRIYSAFVEAAASQRGGPGFRDAGQSYQHYD
jgi:putative glutamine amidotransferase